MTERSMDPSFTDSNAKRILARAAELDAINGTTLRLPELRAIAAEVGISAEAFDQAVAEARRVPAPRDTVRPRPRSLLGTVTLIAVGAALGTLSVAADSMGLGGASVFAVFGPSAAFTAYRAQVHRRKGSLSSFLNEAAVLFGSFTAGVGHEWDAGAGTLRGMGTRVRCGRKRRGHVRARHNERAGSGARALSAGRVRPLHPGRSIARTFRGPI